MIVFVSILTTPFSISLSAWICVFSTSLGREPAQVQAFQRVVLVNGTESTEELVFSASPGSSRHRHQARTQDTHTRGKQFFIQRITVTSSSDVTSRSRTVSAAVRRAVERAAVRECLQAVAVRVSC